MEVEGQAVDADGSAPETDATEHPLGPLALRLGRLLRRGTPAREPNQAGIDEIEAVEKLLDLGSAAVCELRTGTAVNALCLGDLGRIDALGGTQAQSQVAAGRDRIPVPPDDGVGIVNIADEMED